MNAQQQVAAGEARAARFQRIWMMTYVALFSALLAFFVVLITQVQLEGIAVKRAHQQLTQQLYLDVKDALRRQGMDWVRVENDFPKGVRLYPAPALFADAPLFAPGSDRINPRFEPYLTAMGRLLRALDLARFQQRYGLLVQQIESRGFRLRLTLRVEGHTDSRPLPADAPFTDAMTLSLYRADRVRQALQRASLLADEYWAIAGYGALHPLFADPADARNERVELYLQPDMWEDTRP